MALTQVSTGGIKDGQIHTADLADGAISAVKLEATTLDQTYTLGADGTNHYTFTGEGLTGAVNDPTLYLTRGKTYRFVNANSSGAHPFRIQTTVNGSAGTEYNTGVTNNGGAGGSTIIFEVPHSAPDVLYYQCTSHGSMGGILYVTGALADGTVTTAKLASSVSSAIAANTAKDLTALSASNLTSGTIPDARFPATLPTASAANLTAVPAANITGTLPAISGANLTNLDATNLTGTIADARFPATLPAASAANLTNVPAANITGTLPAISGANLTNLPGGGKLLQVQSTFKSSSYHFSHGGWGAVPGLSVNIIPQTNSKIYVMCNIHFLMPAVGSRGSQGEGWGIKIYRDSSNIWSSGGAYDAYLQCNSPSSAHFRGRHQWMYYDTNPGGNGSSIITYSIQSASHNGYSMQISNMGSTISVWEIAP